MTPTEQLFRVVLGVSSEPNAFCGAGRSPEFSRGIGLAPDTQAHPDAAVFEAPQPGNSLHVDDMGEVGRSAEFALANAVDLEVGACFSRFRACRMW